MPNRLFWVFLWHRFHQAFGIDTEIDFVVEVYYIQIDAKSPSKLTVVIFSKGGVTKDVL